MTTRREKIVVLTGAGISAESGLRTFRDTDGLWEGYRVEDVATPGAWRKDPQLVLDFYNERRKQALRAKPNAAHLALVELERYGDVRIITQNIDDLHERAGSSHVLHLHGEIRKARSSIDEHWMIDLCTADGEVKDIHLGDTCPLGSQLRPHVVWFGEAVPAMKDAGEIVAEADELVIIGTSLAVYPAAGLVYEAKCANQAPHRVVVIDPKADQLEIPETFKKIATPATVGVPQYLSRWRERSA